MSNESWARFTKRKAVLNFLGDGHENNCTNISKHSLHVESLFTKLAILDFFFFFFLKNTLAYALYVIFLPLMYATLMTFLHLIVAGYPTLGERLEELTKQNKYLINTNAGSVLLVTKELYPTHALLMVLE